MAEALASGVMARRGSQWMFFQVGFVDSAMASQRLPYSDTSIPVIKKTAWLRKDLSKR